MASQKQASGEIAGGVPDEVIREAQAAVAGNEDNYEPSHRPSSTGHKGAHLHPHQADSSNIEDVPAPAYNGADYGQLDISQNGLDTGARVASDGRVNIKFNQKSRKLANLLVPALRQQLDLQHRASAEPEIPPGLAEYEGLPPPPMNVVIQIVGSRGDVQPFIALGQVLKNKYNHRVRIATHPTFRDFVIENGLEFFSISGDPSELMAFMVKNPGLMPGFDSLKNGDVGKRRKGIYEIITGCWRSCIEAGDGTGVQVSDDNQDSRSFDSGISLGVDATAKPFVADVIIANPPSFAHVHLAERLGIPLHLMFTMPWSPTQSFPHPLANITSSNADANMANFITYALVDMLTWQGLGDVINKFRERSLGLEPVSIMWAPGMASRLRIPWTYCWSPALIPKPRDWGNYIDISGFFFLNLASNYTPAQDLADFLAAGPPPVYIGFGSIVVDDPNAMTQMIFEAVKKTGQRALVSKGWGGLGADQLGIPEGVFMLGNCPHDWLFNQVSCVVHHGGAGTTAAGISAGRPTVVVPFFGDQPFWGAMTARAGAGPMPVPYKTITADKLAAAIKEALKPESLERAKELSEKIKKEDGTQSGAESFHKQLRTDELRCTLYPRNVAVWRVKRTDIRLSALAATVLGNEGLLDFTDLKLYRPREYETEDGPWDPISGGASALIGTIGNLSMGVADFPVEILRSLKAASTDHQDVSEKAKPVPSSDTSTPISSSQNGSSVDLARASGANSDKEHAVATDAGSIALTESAETVLSPKDIGVTSPTETNTSTNTATRKPSAMSSVLNPAGSSNQRRGSRHGSRSGSRAGSPHGHGAARNARGDDQVTLDSAIGGAKAVEKIVTAGIKSPGDFMLGLAKGFHNAPKLYGDDTVRKNEKITGVASGLRVAGKEFGYGFFDGITGLVTQPLAGARKEGAAGFIKGAAKGVGGLILKPGAGVWGLPGYTFKGIMTEVQKLFGSSAQNYIIAARTAQGYEEWKQSSPEQRLQIVAAWKSTKLEMKKQGKKYGKEREAEIKQHISRSGSNTEELVSGFQNTRHLTWDERKTLAELKAQRKKEKKETERNKSLTEQERKRSVGKRGTPGSLNHGSNDHNQLASSIPGTEKSPSPGQIQGQDLDKQNAEFEEAIQRSVAATSRGIPEEDALIERALRASVKELQNASAGAQSQDAYERAVAASVSEVKAARSESKQESGVTSSLPSSITMEDNDPDEEDAELTKALTRSLEEHKASQQASGLADTGSQHRHFHHHDQSGRDWSDSEDSGLGTDEDEAYAHALEKSKRDHDEAEEKRKSEVYDEKDADVEPNNDDELKRAMTQSEKDADEIARQKTEEEIVLAYVKRQSLLEEEARKRMLAQKQ